MGGESTTDLDRKRKELGKDSKRSAEAISSGGPQGDIGPADELFRQGEDLCRRGLYEEAIHVWTRILFLERADTRAKGAIEGAKRAVSERQRELDVELAVAEELLASGDIDGAASGVDHILSRDPRHAEGHQLAERIAARQRRPDVTPANVGAVAVHENDNVDESLPLSKRGLRLRVSHEASPRLTPSSLKMGGFALGVILVFASGALYLHLNWESIVSDGAFVTVTGVTGAALAPGGAGPVDAVVPGASELRYYNGARLFAKGRYREALAELSLVGRDDAVSERARSLILRIEDRLLRGGELDHEQPSKAVR
jgi:hypothetical protein